MNTRAVVCRTFGQPLSAEEIDIADPDAGEIRAKPKACAICHSDIFHMDGVRGGGIPAVAPVAKPH